MRSRFPRRTDVIKHASVLCACLAIILAVNFGRPGLVNWSGQLKGPDFLQFYVAGSIGLSGDSAALYDANAFAKLGVKRVPESSGVYYLPIYGPQMSLWVGASNLDTDYHRDIWRLLLGGVEVVPASP